MKATSSTTYNLDFPMKDGKKVHSFKMSAASQEEAEATLLLELLECSRQLEAEKRVREEKKKPVEQK